VVGGWGRAIGRSGFRLDPVVSEVIEWWLRFAELGQKGSPKTAFPPWVKLSAVRCSSGAPRSGALTRSNHPSPG